MSTIEERLWNPRVPESIVADKPELYYGLILEQYKLYVEMADRVSQRRGLTNTFFLTLNTGAFAAMALLGSNSGINLGNAILAVLSIVLVMQCGAWAYLIRSHKQLNSAKFQVVGALEARLPASPFWQAEWVALGEGKDRRRYWPLAHLEKLIPIFFAAAYVVGLVIFITT